MQVNLTEQIALVTGAANGIGKAIADRLSANGATVIYTDIDRTRVERAAQEGGGHALELDVTHSDRIGAVMAEVQERFQRLDILVNNAGINTLAHRVCVDTFPREEWDRIVDIELWSVKEEDGSMPLSVVIPLCHWEDVVGNVKRQILFPRQGTGAVDRTGKARVLCRAVDLLACDVLTR